MIGKAFSDAVSGIATDLENRVKDSLDYCVKVMADPRATTQDADLAFRRFEDSCKDTIRSATGAAKEEIKEHVTRRMGELGMSPEEIDKWFEQKWVDVKGMADPIIGAAPNVKEKAHFVWLKVVGVLAAAGVVVMAIGNGHHGGKQLEAIDRTVDRQGVELKIQEIETKAGLEISMDDRQFDQMVEVLNADNTPQVTPDPIVIPAPVAAIAALPVVAKIETNGELKTVNTNVGQVYRAVPAARTQIERSADHSLNFHYNINVVGPGNSLAHFSN